MTKTKIYYLIFTTFLVSCELNDGWVKQRLNLANNV